MKMKRDNYFSISAFQVLDRAEILLKKEISEDSELSNLNFEYKRITNFYNDSTYCQIFWKKESQQTPTLLLSVEIRESSQKSSANAFKSVFRTEKEYTESLSLIRIPNDIGIEAHRVSLYLKALLNSVVKFKKVC